jgi:hyperosmotically inducible protein
MRKLHAAVLALVIALSPLATTACAPHHGTAADSGAFDDATISTRVKTALLNDPDIGALRIDVNTAQGVVTLSGQARSAAEAQKAVQLAHSVPGVKDVKSELKVGGISHSSSVPAPPDPPSAR